MIAIVRFVSIFRKVWSMPLTKKIIKIKIIKTLPSSINQNHVFVSLLPPKMELKPPKIKQRRDWNPRPANDPWATVKTPSWRNNVTIKYVKNIYLRCYLVTNAVVNLNGPIYLHSRVTFVNANIYPLKGPKRSTCKSDHTSPRTFHDYIGHSCLFRWHSLQFWHAALRPPNFLSGHLVPGLVQVKLLYN
jgi:hypothetical protein